jgi:predicted ATPase/DNA-binding CsgD family transcriptional regulator
MNNLPVQLNHFIGRQHEIAEVKRLLAASRLITLTGAGGCGKTRLSLQVAANLSDAYDDGVWWIELAPLVDPMLVPQAVAIVLNVREQPNQSILDSLMDYLHSKNMLLVLDNCEHLIDACAHFANTILSACPNLRILATSREALNIAGESAWTVPSLSLPDVAQQLPFTELSQYEAVQLFVDRAVAVQPGFKLTDLNARAVIQVCQRLDGIPLAIELAAARMKVLQSAEIVARLDDRFNLLTTGSRTELPRHQTLRAAIDWSYDLLTEPERVLLQRLSVFAGGGTLAAVEQVCSNGLGQEGILPNQILDLLSHLVDKSVVISQTDSGRYRLLETIRQYGHEKLVQSGDAELIHQRHLKWLVQFAKEVDPKLRGPEITAWAQRLDDELDNVRTALEWAFEHGRNSDGAELLGALAWYHFLRSHDREAKRWSVKAESLTRDASSTVRAEALFALGIALTDLGEEEPAEFILQQALTHYRATENQLRTGFVLNTLGMIKHRQAQFEQAEHYYDEALRLRRATGDKWGITHTLQNIGGIATDTGDYRKAEALYEEGLALAEDLGDERMVARYQSFLGSIAYIQSDLKRAGSLLRGAISTLWRMRENSSLFQATRLLAQVMTAEGQPRRAAQMLSAMEFAREQLGTQSAASDQAELEKVLGMIRDRAGDTEFRQTWADGRGMSLEQAVEIALTEIETLNSVDAHPAVLSSRRAAKEKFGGLTEREREVAAHLAKGESNREIAEALVVTQRTVESHVTNILHKLGFTSRAQIRRWVLEKGLVRRME